MNSRNPLPLLVVATLTLFSSGCGTPDQATVAASSAEVRSLTSVDNVQTMESPKFKSASERVSGTKGWWATKWTAEKGDGFKGEPQGAPGNSVIVRYDHYAVSYDPARRAPVWGAYTVDRGVKAIRDSGTRGEKVKFFGRPDFFEVEPVVVKAAKQMGLGHALDKEYRGAIDPRYPVDPALTPKAASYTKAAIQIGHIVPNNAMKCTGDELEGRTAQLQSFSLANVVPQMNAHNAPTWEALEDDVIDWTARFGRVWVICGPIYSSRPPFMMRGRVHGEDRGVPSPDAMFCVVAVMDSGRLRTAAFIVPHVPQNLKYSDYSKSVDDVEQATGLNFLPELGEPAAVEAENARWLFSRN